MGRFPLGWPLNTHFWYCNCGARPDYGGLMRGNFAVIVLPFRNDYSNVAGNMCCPCGSQYGYFPVPEAGVIYEVVAGMWVELAGGFVLMQSGNEIFVEPEGLCLLLQLFFADAPDCIMKGGQQDNQSGYTAV